MRSARVVSRVIKIILGRGAGAADAMSTSVQRNQEGNKTAPDRHRNEKGVYHRQTPGIRRAKISERKLQTRSSCFWVRPARSPDCPTATSGVLVTVPKLAPKVLSGYE